MVPLYVRMLDISEVFMTFFIRDIKKRLMVPCFLKSIGHNDFRNYIVKYAEILHVQQSYTYNPSYWLRRSQVIKEQHR